MLKQLLLTICLVGATTVFAQDPVKFTKYNHSFGKIKHNKPVTHEFSFTNISDKPVVIEFVNADCGCTTPDYPKQAIAKGQTGKIKVTFNAATIGTFKKTVTIKFVKNNKPFILNIDGEVLADAAKKKAK